jgi:hypothetical protein
MSELSLTPADRQDVVEEPEHVTETISQQQPVVITEQQVAFSTAAAVSLPRTKPTHGVIAAVRAKFRHSSVEGPPIPRHYPPRREEFIEDAAMAREMFRL